MGIKKIKLICFLTKEVHENLAPLSCLYDKYEAVASSQLTLLSMKSGNHRSEPGQETVLDYC